MAPEAAQIRGVAESQILPNEGAVPAGCQPLNPGLNEVLHVNYLLLLRPRPKHNAHPGARKGTFLGCTPARRKERPSDTTQLSS